MLSGSLIALQNALEEFYNECETKTLGKSWTSWTEKKKGDRKPIYWRVHGEAWDEMPRRSIEWVPGLIQVRVGTNRCIKQNLYICFRVPDFLHFQH